VKAAITPKEIYFMHNKENNIRNTVHVSMFQKPLANKNLRLRDSRLSLIQPSGGLGFSPQKINKARVEHEPHVATWLINHGWNINCARPMAAQLKSYSNKMNEPMMAIRGKASHNYQ